MNNYDGKQISFSDVCSYIEKKNDKELNKAAKSLFMCGVLFLPAIFTKYTGNSSQLLSDIATGATLAGQGICDIVGNALNPLLKSNKENPHDSYMIMQTTRYMCFYAAFFEAISENILVEGNDDFMESFNALTGNVHNDEFNVSFKSIASIKQGYKVLSDRFREHFFSLDYIQKLDDKQQYDYYNDRISGLPSIAAQKYVEQINQICIKYPGFSQWLNVTFQLDIRDQIKALSDSVMGQTSERLIMTPFAERYNYFINTCFSQTLLSEKSTPSYEAVYEEINCNSSISIDEFKQMLAGNIEPPGEVKYAISDLFGLNPEWMVKGYETERIFAEGLHTNYNPLSILDLPNIKKNSTIIGLFFSGNVRYALVVIKESEFCYKYIKPIFIFHLGKGGDTLSRTANFYRFIARSDAMNLLYEHVYQIDESIAYSIISGTMHPAVILKGNVIKQFAYDLYYWDNDTWTLGYDQSQSFDNYINQVKEKVDELNQIDNDPRILSVATARRSAKEYPSDTKIDT